MKGKLERQTLNCEFETRPIVLAFARYDFGSTETLRFTKAVKFFGRTAYELSQDSPGDVGDCGADCCSHHRPE